MSRVTRSKREFHGMFELPAESAVLGHLVIKKESTVLKLNGDARALPREEANIFGVTGDGLKISCLDCFSHGTSTRMWEGPAGEPTLFHQTRFFPHYVLIGREHVDDCSPRIREISFTSTDLGSLFEDHDAFGTVINAAPLMDSVLGARRRQAAIKVGLFPQIAYFTGNDIVSELESELGHICVRNHLRTSTSGISGAAIRNRVRLHVTPREPLTLSKAIDHISTLARLLSVLAGRPQAIRRIRFFLSGEQSPIDKGLKVFWSHSPKRGNARYTREPPHMGDVPLDPIRRQGEFVSSVQRWLQLDVTRRDARLRHANCAQKGGRYSFDRIVAAANMFDLLPKNTFEGSPLSGESKLRWKIGQRADVVRRALGEEALPGLHDAIRAAVACRNHLVHGPDKSGFNYSAAQHHLPFLTDCLEFIFEASDLIDCGWDARSWCAKYKGTAHSLASFLWGYSEQSAHLRQAQVFSD